MEDLFRQLQEELRLLREEREKDKVIRLALEKKLQEAGIMELPELEQQPIAVICEVERVDGNGGLDLIGDLSDLSELSDLSDEEEEVAGHTPQALINPPSVVSPKPEISTPPQSSTALIITPPKPNISSSSTPGTTADLVSTVNIKLNLAKKMKPKADASAFTISASRRAHYMAGSSLLSITPAPHMVSLSRAALNAEYGCTTMGLLWRSPKGGKRQFLFPTYEMNPDMPRGPGEPGLLLGCRDELWTYGPWTLFYHLADTKLVRMGYAGEYECKVVAVMSKEDFAAQSYEVKRSWADKIATRVRYECYVEIRARITLRKENPLEEPTVEEVKAKVQSIKRMKRFEPPELTCQDVIDAFTRGEESIRVIRVECVNYDHSKAKQYLPLQVKYEEQQKSKASSKAKTTAKPRRKPLRAANSESKILKPRKRAASFINISDDDDDEGKGIRNVESEGSDAEFDEFDVLPSRPAKRSRYTSPLRGGQHPIEDAADFGAGSMPQRPVRSRKKTFKAVQEDF